MTRGLIEYIGPGLHSFLKSESKQYENESIYTASGNCERISPRARRAWWNFFLILRYMLGKTPDLKTCTVFITYLNGDVVQMNKPASCALCSHGF